MWTWTATECQTAVEISKTLVDLVTVVGILFAVWKGIEELKRSRVQRGDEVRVRKMEMAHKLLDELTKDVKAQAATQMIDWSGRSYEINPSQNECITSEDVKRALEVRGRPDIAFTPKEVFIRDCFDRFLSHVGAMERALQRNLIEFEDLRDGLVYYVQRAREQFSDEMNTYAKTYDLLGTTDCLRRFQKS